MINLEQTSVLSLSWIPCLEVWECRNSHLRQVKYQTHPSYFLSKMTINRPNLIKIGTYEYACIASAIKHLYIYTLIILAMLNMPVNVWEKCFLFGSWDWPTSLWVHRSLADCLYSLPDLALLNEHFRNDRSIHNQLV
jgi:hypothetical protein